MSIVVWIIFGALAGWIATVLTETNNRSTPLANIAVGVLGAFIGGWFVQKLGQSSINGFNVFSVFVALLGACVALYSFHVITDRKRI